MKLFQYLLTITAATLIIAVSGCTTSGPVKAYGGPTLPISELAIVTVPGSLDVKTVDGKKVKVPYVENGRYEVRVLPGIHKITVAYIKFWGDATSGHLVKSDPVEIQVNAQPGITYKINQNEPTDMDSAEKHVMHFKIWIDDPETGQHYVSYGPDEFAPPTNQNTPSQAQATSEKNNTSQDSLERLKYWWGKADKNNRKDFLQWIVEEPSK